MEPVNTPNETPDETPVETTPPTPTPAAESGDKERLDALESVVGSLGEAISTLTDAVAGIAAKAEPAAKPVKLPWLLR